MNLKTKQVQENISLEPCVTIEDLHIAKRYEQLVEDFDLIRGKYDIRNKGSHELSYTQRKQLERVRKYEAELRTKYSK